MACESRARARAIWHLILPVIQCRLSAVRHASRIVAMAQGSIVESGTHEALLAKAQGVYAHLWHMQDGAHPDSQSLANIPTTATTEGAAP